MSTESARKVRVHPTDSIGLGLSDNSARINFALEEGDGEQSDQTAVFMTHRTLKLLQLTLQMAVKNLEAASGHEIPFDAEKIQALDDALRAGIQKSSD